MTAIRAFLAAALICLSLPALAQDAPDYGAWNTLASSAEGIAAAGRASDTALANVRARVDAFRAEFLAAQGINSTRLDTLRAQLEALGAAPAEGETEEPALAARRAELETQISELSAPGLRAQEAFRRADGIITEIDTLLRERRAATLSSRGPTPLNPATWLPAIEPIRGSLADIRRGVERTIETGSAREQMAENAPAIAFLLFIAALFVLRARTWLERVVERIVHQGHGAGARLAGFVVSLGQIIIPVLGLFALSRALLLTGLFEFGGSRILTYLPVVGLGFFVPRWLAGRLLPSLDELQTPLKLPPDSHAGGRLLLYSLGTTLLIFGLVRVAAAIDDYSLESRSVLQFPFFLIIAYLLYRIGRLLGRHTPEVDEEGTPIISVQDRLIALLSRLARLVAIFGGLAAAAGYVNGAESVLLPAVHTLALFATLALLVQASRDAYVVISRRPNAEDSLIPVLIAAALLLLSLPVFALIWGATVNDLREIGVAIQAGVTVGDTTISPSTIFFLFLVFGIGYALTRFAQSALRSSVLPKTNIDIGGQTAITSGLGYVGIFIAALAAISAAGIDLTSFAFIAGALGVGIGFGLQNIVSNFISGIILLIERPISEGDWIDVNGNMGFVRDISVRYTRVETFDRTDVIIPNADLISGTVTNYTRGNSVGRVIVPVGVAYGTDTKRVAEILTEIAHAHPMVTLNPPPNILFIGFGADSLDFEIRAILRDVIWVMNVKSEMNHEIAKRFAEEGIEIPFAQRDVWLRNPEALQPGRRSAGQEEAALPASSGDAKTKPQT